MFKNLACLIPLVLAICLLAAGVAQAADPNLVGWWKLNEGSGSIAYDSSGNNNTGTLVGNPLWVPGQISGALEFRGSQYVNCGSNSVLQIQNEISVTCWIKIDEFQNSWETIISKGDDSYRLSRSATTGNAVHFGINGTTAEGWGWFDGTVVVTDNQWHHVAGIYDGAQGMIYVDGVLDRAVPSTGQINASNFDFLIGENAQASNRNLNGVVDDVRIYNRALTERELVSVIAGIGDEPGLALNPNPENEEEDVFRDVVLSWTPGEYAAEHDIYLGKDFDDVNEASVTLDPAGVYMGRQDPNRYPDNGSVRLELGQTYYWRIDEVNAPPDSTIYKGEVWSFIVEPVAYPIDGANINATASSFEQGKGPQNTINGSGLDATGLLHNRTSNQNMWLSSADGEQPTWIEFEFDKIYSLGQVWIWNFNDSLEQMVGLGFRETIIEYSVDGIDYTTLGTTHEFTQGPGQVDYEHNTTIDFEGAMAKYVRLTANSNWGEILTQYGLSEVRFFYIPVNAREPYPEDGAIDIPVDVTLKFKPGRNAITHNLYYGVDMQTVIDATEPAAVLSDKSYGPLSLDLGETYYWRIDEVNDLNTDSPWAGEVWSFKTLDYIVVEDFESYGDYPPNEVFMTWIDGYGDPTNGSTAGYPEPDFVNNQHYLEGEIVHSGWWSMPLFYNNSSGISEVTRTLNDDWTENGVDTLTLWFYGDENNADETMYIAINNDAVVSHFDSFATTLLEWTRWDIPLQQFVDRGADLSNVETISIGFGNKANPFPGGSGVVFFDDIRLYLP